MSCQPQYAYRPTFTPSTVSCTAPCYNEHRSRAIIQPAGDISTTPAALFFRSVSQSNEANLITVELASSVFTVRVNGLIVETYTVFYGTGSVADLRAQITNRIPASIIEMPPLTFDVYDTRTAELDDLDSGSGLMGGLGDFSTTSLTGGEGAPTSLALSTIRTGPDRSIYIVVTTEDVVGNDITPPANRRIQQWDGTQWISYCNNVQGSCPLEGTC